jgi:hypothetical protein
VITLEPGASPDASTVAVNGDQILIEGDPNVPASILPVESIHVTASAGDVSISNLNLFSLTLDATNVPQSTRNVLKCLIGNLTENGSASGFTQNTIGSAVFSGSNLDLIANNIFDTKGPVSLFLQNCMGTIITQNTFYNFDSSSNNGIYVFNSGGPVLLGGPITISNNTIALSGPPNGSLVQNSIGIRVEESGTSFPDTEVKILNNSISTNFVGIGLNFYTDAGNITALVQGNDFWNNSIGVSITGSPTGNPGIIDMGGGSQGSLGGNDFREWNSTNGISSTVAAIVLNNTSAKIPSATDNLFDFNVIPSQVCSLNGNIINLGGPQGGRFAFVQSLYNKALGRTGTHAEIVGWLNIFATQGQAAVVNGILRSAESLGRIVDSLYLRFLGRQSDAAGRAGWVNALQNGATLESIETGFLTSPEYLHHIDTDFVQSLYINILGRTGSAFELAFWDNQIQAIGLAGIANAFVTSQEYKNDNINADFETYLHRPVFPSELSSFGAMQTDLLSLEAAILSTPAYINVA